jgi:pimeloyl-ACP methyl ester carboxylesterase
MFHQPTEGFIEARGLLFHYCRWSASSGESEKPALFLLHGLASALQIWNLVAPLLAEKGYEVFALDQRGHGTSSKPASGYDFATIVEDDAAIAQALGLEQFVIVGHSWGAAVALEYASLYPEQIFAAILVDGATSQFSNRLGWTRELALERLAPPRFAGTPRATFLNSLRQGPLGAQWSPELEEIFLQIVELRPDDTVAPRLSFENHLQIISAMWDQQTLALYQRVIAPITLIVAESATIDGLPSDFMLQKRADLVHVQQLRPDIALIILADTIHDVPLQRPHELARLIAQAVSVA